MATRQQRLAALAAKAGKNKVSAYSNEKNTKKADGNEEASKVVSRKVIFRNYTPADSELEERGEPSAKRRRPSGDKKNMSEVLERALKEAQVELSSKGRFSSGQEMGIVDPNAAIKRDIQPQLDKLKKRTRKAVLELLKARLEQEATSGLD